MMSLLGRSTSSTLHALGQPTLSESPKADEPHTLDQDRKADTVSSEENLRD